MNGIYQAGQDVIKAFSCALDVADEWMQDVFNGTSSKTIQLDEDELITEEEESDQATDWSEASSGTKLGKKEANVKEPERCGQISSASFQLFGELGGGESECSHQDHWDWFEGDPPSLMPGVNIDNVPDRPQDFCSAC